MQKMRGEGPLERVRDAGINSASMTDLVAVGFSRRDDDVVLMEPVARRMLQRFGSLRKLCEAGHADLEAISGLSGFEVVRAMALLELGRRCGISGAGRRETIDSPEDAIGHLEHIRYEKREHFLAILLDSKNHVIRVAEIHIGTLSTSLVGTREVFREAIRDGASSIIVAHNHPSGDPTPSQEDIDITMRLVEAGQLLDIQVADHIIVGEYCVSLRGGKHFGGSMGRNRGDVAREGAKHARGEGVRAWPLSDPWATLGPVDPPRTSSTV